MSTLMLMLMPMPVDDAGPGRDVLGTWQMRLCRCQEPGARSKAGRREASEGKQWEAYDAPGDNGTDARHQM